MGEAVHADKCTRGQVPLKVLEALATYTMVLVYIRRKVVVLTTSEKSAPTERNARPMFSQT